MDINSPPDHYLTLAVPFGDRPSGAIAVTAMHETAKRNQQKYPGAARVIMRNTYVDDILKSVPTVDHAKTKIKEIENLLIIGSFKVKDWIVSGPDGMHDGLTAGVKLTDNSEGTVLGMTWKPKEDVFMFRVDTKTHINTKTVTNNMYTKNEINEISQILTRRIVLSQVSRIYDPLGLLVPFTLKGKFMMREICIPHEAGNSSKSHWDNQLPTELCEKCVKFFLELPKLRNIEFKRCLKPFSAIGNPMFIIFCDGSQQSYGTCAYIRWQLSNGTFVSNLICAKNRLAPMKLLTIPKIELCAAGLACRLRSTITKELDLIFSEDQIQKDSYTFGTFVANRVAEIQSCSKPSEWWWVASQDNVADLTTRVVGVEQLDSYWKHGTKYLEPDIQFWPLSQGNLQSPQLPDTITTHHIVTIHGNNSQECYLSIIDVSRYSNVDILLRVTAAVQKIAKNKTFNCDAFNLDSQELQFALRCWILFVQQGFKDDWNKRFKRLGPAMKDNITVGHRITHWLNNNWDKETLILLPAKSPFSKLVVLSVHCTNHDGIDTTVAKVRKDYWMPQLIKLAKQIRQSGYRCRIRDYVNIKWDIYLLRD